MMSQKQFVFCSLETEGMKVNGPTCNIINPHFIATGTNLPALFKLETIDHLSVLFDFFSPYCSNNDQSCHFSVIFLFLAVFPQLYFHMLRQRRRVLHGEVIVEKDD